MQNTKLVLVTVCTNRKSIPPLERLQAERLPSGCQEAVSKTWRAWLREAARRVPAKRLYAGRGFTEALAVVESRKADLWIVSAGLGLVHGDEEVPGYDLTLSAGSDSSVARKVTDGPFDASRWWSDLGRRRRPKRSLAELLSSHPAEHVVISLPGSYMELVQEDLQSAGSAALCKLRLVGPLDLDRVAPRLRPLVMPYDDRLNGPISPLNGTRADFPQRAARHFLEQACADGLASDPEDDAARVRASLRDLAWPAQANRRPLGDDEIVKVILASWDRASGQSTKMLRLLRDEEGIACEQGRFVQLFKRADNLRQLGSGADRTLRLRAVRSHQGNGKQIYTFFIPGEMITQIADITRIHRDGTERLAGFQRGEIKRHVNGIVEYLDQGDVLFPNAIILALSPDVSFVQTRGGKPDGALDAGEAGTLSIPLRSEGSRVAWIVDGQQRSLALSKAKNGGLNVPVVAFVAPDVATRRAQFILVNKAKPLPSRLINELLPEVDVQLPRDLSGRKIPSALCETLDEDPDSPFHGLIKRVSKPKDGTAVVIDSAVVEMIRASLKNPNGALAPFVSLGNGPSDVEGMYRTLVDYWDCVKVLFPYAWGLPPESSRLMHSAGIRAMGVLMDRIVTRSLAHPNSNAHRLSSLKSIAPYCRWTEGVWEGLGLAWNEIEQTPRHIRQLSQLLCQLDYNATAAQRNEG
ncbi:MAG: DGQHR domain protein [Candidatus Accumulibacter adjunctus]|uniref:DGQHR domain protein n=1 Tax=Candidatus Accumulibacter adjunctus TaxID=1454001 RepID=A0A011NL30_9PROT|nr:MAG: DGQHR domain protein [Candidatus Accumulibacter adjunctus]